MPRLVTDWFRKAVIFASLCSPLFAVGTAAAQGQTAYVLTTTNQLITIDVNNPGAALASVNIVGINAGETLVGIDVRPENGFLYGLGVNHATDTMSVYAISARTGQAGVVGTPGFTGAGDLPDPAVARYGIDFNPAVDRLRVTTSQSGAGPAVPGLNFRLNVTSGTLVNALPDAAINPAPISIDEVAYTNNGRHGGVTTLYTISSAQDALYIQNPPNNGVQTGAIALSQNLTALHGFDMDSQAVAAASNGPVTAGSSQAFAVVTAGGVTGLARINLLTGAVSAITPIANNTTNIRGFAVRDVRVPGSFPATALDSSGTALIRFNTATPGTTSTSALGGLIAGDVMVGIDLRPQTGQLYGLGFNAGANTVQLYRIDPWTTIGTSTAAPLGPTFALPLAGATAFGFDFNPAVDRIRVVTNAGNNFRLNPDTGAVAGNDPVINPPGRVVTGAAYTNSFGQPIPSGATTLYTLDATNDTVAIQTPPNNGTQTASKTVTLSGSPLDFTSVNGFDIAADVRVTTNNAAAAGLSYAILTVGGVTNLYSIDLATGAAALIGGGFPGPRSGLSIGDSPIQVTATTLTASPAQAPLGENVTFTATVAPATATGTVTFFVDGNPVATVAVAGGQATFTTNTLAVGNYQVTATFSGSSDAAGSSTPTPFALVVGQFKQHFAEGSTGFFQTDIGILNASATQTANVTASFFPSGAASFTQTFQLTPMARRTLDVNAILAAQGLSAAVSTLIESDQPIAATRQMTYGTPVYGSTLESGVPDTALTWYFAEGATSVYSLYFLIENPNNAATNVTFTHLVEGGAPVTRNVSVPALSRETFNVNEVPGLAEAALSTVVSSTLPIVAERAMYITGASTRLFEAGTAGVGATALSTQWSFAEGATGFFFTYLLLGNPQTTPADVTVVYQLPDGTTIPKTYTVNPQERRTVDVANQDPLLASASFSMTITSTQPIVCERAMWWNLPFYEGSVALGTTSTGAAWGIGEGAEAGPINESTFVLVSNGSSSAATVRFTVVYDDGTASEQKEFSMVATSRRTVRIADDFPSSVGKRFSVLVESLTPAAPITVEYARYQSPGRFLDAGGAALATRVR